MFGVQERERVVSALVAVARDDSQIVSAALVGSSASGGDRYSDVDLAMAVVDGASVHVVLDRWTRSVLAGFDAVVLFDLPVGPIIYRVFLLPGMLQVDLSFAPAADFVPRGPRFRLLFGDAGPPAPHVHGTVPDEFGLGVHHVVRANVCIGRGQPWQAEYWIHQARDVVLTLACRRLGLEASYGRGFDTLPPEVVAGLRGSIVPDLDGGVLRCALAVVTAALLREAEGITDAPDRVRAILDELHKPVSL